MADRQAGLEPGTQRDFEGSQFWDFVCDQQNLDDLQDSIRTDGLIALVDETCGGIIAYILPGNEDSLLAHLNGE